MSKLFEQEISKHIVAYDMIEPGDKVIVGVSGGRDSICLLTVLGKLAKDWEFGLYAVHVNHMLRGEASENDKKFVMAFCEKNRIPCMAVSVDVRSLAESNGMSLEEAGRTARLKVFEEAAKKLLGNKSKNKCKVALGHHRDDNVETIILNLIRGSNLNGITGMSPKLERDQVTLIRPLLCVGKEDIDGYLNSFHIPYVEDETNSSDEYARNKIRLNVIPELQKVNSRVVEHINDTAGRLTQIEEYISKQIKIAAAGIVDERGNGFALDVLRLKAEDPAIRSGVVYHCLGMACGTLKDISHIHVNDILSLMDKQTGRKIELPYGLIASRSYGNIMLTRVQEVTDKGPTRADYERNELKVNLSDHIDISLKDLMKERKEYVIGDGSRISFDIIEVNDENREFLVKKNIYTKAFDCDTIKGTLILGKPEPDDEIKFSGGTKSLKKYFTDEKIPWEIRSKMLVLKDINGVLWVLGYRIGEQYKITDRTQKALIVSVTGGNDEQGSGTY